MGNFEKQIALQNELLGLVCFHDPLLVSLGFPWKNPSVAAEGTIDTTGFAASLGPQGTSVSLTIPPIGPSNLHEYNDLFAFRGNFVIRFSLLTKDLPKFKRIDEKLLCRSKNEGILCFFFEDFALQIWSIQQVHRLGFQRWTCHFGPRPVSHSCIYISSPTSLLPPKTKGT